MRTPRSRLEQVNEGLTIAIAELQAINSYINSIVPNDLAAFRTVQAVHEAINREITKLQEAIRHDEPGVSTGD